MPKSHKVKEIEPGIWLYSDGIKRFHGHPEMQNGALAPGNKRPAHLKSFTPETSRLAKKAKAEIYKARKQQAQEAIDQAIMQRLGAESGPLAIAKMAGSLAAGVMSKKYSLQGRSAAFKTIATAGGYLQERSGATQAVQFNLSLSDDVVRSLVADGAEVILDGELVNIEREET